MFLCFIEFINLVSRLQFPKQQLQLNAELIDWQVCNVVEQVELSSTLIPLKLISYELVKAKNCPINDDNVSEAVKVLTNRVWDSDLNRAYNILSRGLDQVGWFTSIQCLRRLRSFGNQFQCNDTEVSRLPNAG